MSWQAFESRAPEYEGWYETTRGRRVDRAETRLLAWLLAAFDEVGRVLEVGCGTGHFTRRIAASVPAAVGLDRSPAMLAEARRSGASIPWILGDAGRLPFVDGAADVVVFVTTLEFLDRPGRALREAARVGRQGIVVVALNRYSLGGWSRRWGSRSQGGLLSGARDFTLGSLRCLLRDGLRERIEAIRWRSTLFPAPIDALAPVPLGDVLGLAVVLKPDTLRRGARAPRRSGDRPKPSRPGDSR